MKMQDFIKQNRDQLKAAIKRACSNCPTTDRDIRQWIANDEGLYRWARSEGVKV